MTWKFYPLRFGSSVKERVLSLKDFKFKSQVCLVKLNICSIVGLFWRCIFFWCPQEAWNKFNSEERWPGLLHARWSLDVIAILHICNSILVEKVKCPVTIISECKLKLHAGFKQTLVKKNGEEKKGYLPVQNVRTAQAFALMLLAFTVSLVSSLDEWTGSADPACDANRAVGYVAYSFKYNGRSLALQWLPSVKWSSWWLGLNGKSQRKPTLSSASFIGQINDGKLARSTTPYLTLFHTHLSLTQVRSILPAAMLRVLSTRRSYRGYDQLGKEQPQAGAEEPQLRRATTLPLGSAKKLFPETSPKPDPPAKQAKKASKSHPLFRLFYGRRKGKTTAKPEFSRYIEYMKEGGVWDATSNTPVIYYK